eukprot:2107419-Karenia_brevis.AAC.1
MHLLEFPGTPDMAEKQRAWVHDPRLHRDNRPKSNLGGPVQHSLQASIFKDWHEAAMRLSSESNLWMLQPGSQGYENDAVLEGLRRMEVLLQLQK